MISYSEALELYNSRPVPPRSKKWKAMPDNARPLNRTEEAHKGIHMMSDGTIYYRLYDTKITTLYPPQADGTYVVECNWYDSQTTRNFMNNYGLYYIWLETTDGERVGVPQVPTTYASPHAHLTFTADNKLDITRSHHAEIYTATSTTADKKKRAEFRQKLDTLVTLAMFRLENYKQAVTVDADYGRPFGAGWRMPDGMDVLARYVRDMQYAEKTRGVAVDLNASEFIGKFMAAGQAVLDILINRRMYDADAYVGWHLKNNAAITAAKEAQQRQIIEDVTPEDFRKSLLNKLLSIFNLKQGNARTPWGQFQKTLPRKSYYR